MKKLRFVNENGRQGYLTRLDPQTAIELMKVRLNMTELKGNFRTKFESTWCSLCINQEDSTEHLFNCKGLEKINGGQWSIQDLGNMSHGLWQYIKTTLEQKKKVEVD